MADTTAPTSNVYTWLTSLSPAVIGLVSLLTGLLAGGGGYAYLNRPTMTLPTALPDQPRPAAIVSVADVDHIVTERCNGISGKLDDVLGRLPAKKWGAK